MVSDPSVDFFAFVGIPWGDRQADPSATDCWSLVVDVYRSALGVELPAWDTVPALDAAAVAGAAAQERERWQEIPLGRERPLDIMLIYRGRHASHVGLIVRRGRLLHVERGATSTVERYRPDGSPFRIAGIYRLAG